MDTLLTALRVVVSLAVVIGAIWFIQRRVSRSGVSRGSKRASKPMSVVARQNLGPKASVAVVEFGGKRYLLGVTEHGIAVLDGTEAEAEVEEAVTIDEPAKPDVTTPAAITRRASSKQNSRDFAQALGKAAQVAPAAAVPAVASPVPSPAPALAKAATAPKPAAVRLARPQNFNGMFPEGSSKMAGSILSAATWKQAWTAVRGRS